MLEGAFSSRDLRAVAHGSGEDIAVGQSDGAVAWSMVETRYDRESTVCLSSNCLIEMEIPGIDLVERPGLATASC